jgi:hypothetical protein
MWVPDKLLFLIPFKGGGAYRAHYPQSSGNISPFFDILKAPYARSHEGLSTPVIANARI